MEELIPVLMYILAAFVVYLIIGRLIGWALGISRTNANLEILIDQNKDLRNLLNESVTVQRAMAKKQGVSDEEMDWR